MTTIETYGKIKGGKLLIDNKKRFDAEVAQQKDMDVQVSVKKRGKRSSQQNRYYWSVVVWEITQKFREYGNDTDRESVHEFLKLECNPLYIKNEDAEVIAKLPGSTTGLNKEEFSQYVEKVKIWASTKMGLVIPEASSQTSIEYFK